MRLALAGGESRPSVYLSADSKLGIEDVPLPPLGKPRAGRFTVPAGLPAGAYRVFGCDQPVRDDNGARGCAVAKGTIAVEALPDTDVLMALADAEPEASDASLEAAFSFPRCRAKPGAVPRPVAPGPAARTALKAIASRAGKQAVRGFVRSDSARTAVQAEAAGVAAMLGGGGGLAGGTALLRAYQLEPNNPHYLASAAGALNDAGLYDHAVRLLSAAATLPPRVSAPMGIPSHAFALANRASALAGLGRYDEAGELLESTTRLAPRLVEAHRIHAVVEACRKRPAQAFAAWRISQYRKRYDLVGGEEGGDPFKRPAAEDLLDMSQGYQAEMPSPVYPANWSETPRVESHFREFGAEHLARINARNERADALREGAELDQATPATVRRFGAIVGLLGQLTDRNGLKPLHKATEEQFRATGDYWSETFSAGEAGFKYDCGDVAARLPEAIEMQNELDRRGRAYYRALHEQLTAVAANVQHPGRRALIASYIEDRLDHVFYTLVLHNTDSFMPLAAVRWRNCTESSSSPAGEEAPEPEWNGDFAPCTGLKGLKVKFDMTKAVGADLLPGSPRFSVSASCETISIEGSGPGWVAPFVGASGNVSKGEVTIYGGSKASTPSVPWVPGGSIKSGAYVTFDRDGAVKDFGWRVQPQVQAGNGLEIQSYDKMDFSFVGIGEYMPTVY